MSHSNTIVPNPVLITLQDVPTGGPHSSLAVVSLLLHTKVQVTFDSITTVTSFTQLLHRHTGTPFDLPALPRKRSIDYAGQGVLQHGIHFEFRSQEA